MIRRGHLLMAVYLMWMVVTYMRPSEPLTIRKADLMKPVDGVNKYWSLLLFPEHRRARSKVMASNDSIELYAPWAPWMTRVCEALADGDPESLVFPIAYNEFLKVLRTAADLLGLAVVAYQARHSGPSIDAARHLRTRAEIKTRGRWSADKSVIRYERPARLSQSLLELSQSKQEFCRRAEELLPRLILGECRADALAFPTA